MESYTYMYTKGVPLPTNLRRKVYTSNEIIDTELRSRLLEKLV